jgi:catechol 2,3-dioxygenase-like lactoylglutathione lyase family enzyme
MRVDDILEACLYADDLEAAEAFYAEALGLEVIARVPGRHVFFRCGGRVFLVFRAVSTRGGGAVPAHGAEGARHVCFGVPAGRIDAWRSRLAHLGVPLEREQRWPGGGVSLYLRDPAGNSVELGTPAIWGIDEGVALGAPRA